MTKRTLDIGQPTCGAAESSSPPEEGAISDCLENIKLQGYSLVSADEVGFWSLHSEAVTRANNLISTNMSKVSGSATKSYLHRMSDIHVTDLAFFYNYFTSPVYLKLAADYLRDVPLLTELKLLVSPVGGTSSPSLLEGSQLFHSDFDDEANLKVFVFLSDIDAKSGPLQAVNRSKSEELMEAWGYKWAIPALSHNDAIVPEAEGDSITEFVGAAGSICLIDTVNCLHRGSRFPSTERRILYATFNTRTSFRFPPINWMGLAPKHNSISSPLLKIDPDLYFLNKHGLNT